MKKKSRPIAPARAFTRRPPKHHRSVPLDRIATALEQIVASSVRAEQRMGEIHAEQQHRMREIQSETTSPAPRAADVRIMPRAHAEMLDDLLVLAIAIRSEDERVWRKISVSPAPTLDSIRGYIAALFKKHEPIAMPASLVVDETPPPDNVTPINGVRRH